MRRKDSKESAMESQRSRQLGSPKPSGLSHEMEPKMSYDYPEDSSDIGAWEADWIDLGGEG
jgi:hypothetical protein